MVSNVESRFALNPVNIDMPRSSFDLTSRHCTTFNCADLIPLNWLEVLPGDSLDMEVAFALRAQTLLKPPMDNLYFDIYHFFVPDILIWNHTKEFFGENSSSPWIPQVQYTIPQLACPSGGWNAGTIADYIGVPPGLDNIEVNALPFRAYALIVNEWFRSEVVDDPVVINLGDSTTAGSNGSNYIVDLEKGGMPFKVNKYFDYFTGCLPSPQKGPDVQLPAADLLPVVTTAKRVDPTMFPLVGSYRPAPLMMDYMNWNNSWSSTPVSSNYTSGVAPDSNNRLVNNKLTDSNNPVPITSNTQIYAPSNLWAVNPNGLSGATINELRMAFQIQKFYEAQARGGSRYTEWLREFFRVTPSDATLYRPEYLGGERRMININQVIQQSATDSTSPQGNLAGVSLTTAKQNGFRKSFDKHGYVLTVGCIRYDHTYQQGIDPALSKKTVFDFYVPVFANIGEQPVYNRSIYAQGSTSINPNSGIPYDDEVFGYQEAWAEYRYRPNRTSSEMRSTYAQSLDSWHFGDNYNQLPSLSSAWLKEDKSNVDRALAVTSSVSNQFFGDFLFKCRATRCMPIYSIPGLIDHH